MAGATPELGLATAVDSDDTADYLTLSLANSLRTLDALFNATTGHNHSDAHQGGKIDSGAFSGAWDIPEYFRSTGHASGLPSGGAGIEMYFDTAGGILQAYDRSNSTWRDLYVGGSNTIFGTPGGEGFRLNSDRTMSFASAIAANGVIRTTGLGIPASYTGVGAEMAYSVGNGATFSGIDRKDGVAQAGYTPLFIIGTTLTMRAFTGVFKDATWNGTLFYVDGQIGSAGSVQAGGDVTGTNIQASGALLGGSIRSRGGALYLGPEAGPQVVMILSGGAGAEVVALSAQLFQINGGSLRFATDTYVRRVGVNQVGLPPTAVSADGTSAPITSNGVLLTTHGNLYGGIYYSTVNQFVTWPSEGAYKRDIQLLDDPLAALADPRLVSISYLAPRPRVTDNQEVVMDPPAPDAGRTLGFRVEDWRDRFPELIAEGPGGIHGFNMIGVIPVAWDALRALYAEHLALKAEVASLKGAA